MALPNHVKRLAMDAVGHQATTGQIRLYSQNDEAAMERRKVKLATSEPGVLTDDIKKQAMDAVAYVKARITMEQTEDTRPQVGSRPSSSHATTEKITRLHRNGHSPDFVHQEITRDGFGRDDV